MTVNLRPKYNARCIAWLGILLLGMVPAYASGNPTPEQIEQDSTVGKPVQFADASLDNFRHMELGPPQPVSAVLGRDAAYGAPRITSARPGDESRYFYVYSEYRSPKNHFIPSGWMGDYADLHIDDANTTAPAEGKTCIKLTYDARVSQGYGWAGIYWQDTKDNWGDKTTGFNLKGMNRLTFWARGEKGGEVLSEVKVGGISGTYEDTVEARLGPIVLSTIWQQYTIDLSDADLQRVMGGFAWSASFYSNRDGMTFYLDEIRFEK